MVLNLLLMGIVNLENNLILKDGIWYPQNSTRVSYPEKGNDECFQIEDSSFWFKHRNISIINLAKRFSPGETFWDIGGGNGFVSSGLQQSGFEVVLIEPGVHGCINAKSRGLKNIICSSLENLKFSESSLASCGLFDVAEHIEDDFSFLKNIHFLLKPSGFLYLTVPAYNVLWSDEDVIAGHYRRYTIKSITSLLHSAGFKVHYATYLFSMLPLPIFLFRTIPSKLKPIRKAADIKRLKQDHSNVLLLNKVLKWETERIKKLKRIPLGSSCMVVAQK